MNWAYFFKKKHLIVFVAYEIYLHLTVLQYLKTFLMRLVVKLMDISIWCFRNQVGQHLEDLHNSVSQRFPGDQSMTLHILPM
jgi:hypothetical protein